MLVEFKDKQGVSDREKELRTLAAIHIGSEFVSLQIVELTAILKK